MLRRPPLGHVLASAHDMGREHRIIAALQGSGVPVPPVDGLLRRPRRQRGAVLRDALRRRTRPARHRVGGTSTHSTVEARDTASRSLIDTMAAIHAVDIERGRPRRSRTSRGVHRPPAPALVRPVEPGQDARPAQPSTGCTTRCSERVPEQGRATIVHGDYRLDNCMVADDGRVVAVLDWEICTLGDPLADLGLLHVYWTGPDDPESSLGRRAATTAEGFWNRATARPSGTPKCPVAIISQARLLHRRSPSGSSPASSRVCTRATSAEPSVKRDAAELEPFKVQVEDAAARAERYVEALA